MAAERIIHSNLQSLSGPGFPTLSSIAVNVNDEDAKSISSSFRSNTPLLVTDHGSPEVTDATRRQTPDHTSAVGNFNDRSHDDVI
jgi:hypothetical protein